MGEEKRTLSCTDCGVLNCHKRNASYPEFCLTEKLTDEDIAETTALYEDEENRKVSVISAEIEGEFYGKYTRVDEIIEFAKRMGYKKIGIATCVGLIEESRILQEFFGRMALMYIVQSVRWVLLIKQISVWMRSIHV